MGSPRAHPPLLAVLLFALSACAAPPEPSPATPTAASSVTSTQPAVPSPTHTAATTPAATSASPTAAADRGLSPVAVGRIMARWRGEIVATLPTGRRSVALTVDCGGNDAGLASILATLRRHAVRATFFVTGAFARDHPDAVRRIVGAGHAVGNHTDTHPDLADASPQRISAQLATADRAIVRAGGAPARP